MNTKNTYKTRSFDLSLENQDFEFSFVSTTPLKPNTDIIFCGKLIKDRDFVDGKQFDRNKKDLGSVSYVNSKSNSSSSTRSFRSQSVKQHKALIGITKIPQKMELSDLKIRQSKGNRPLLMFPPAADVDNGCGVGGKRCRIWSLLKPLRCRDHSFNTLSKASLGYIPNL